MVITLKEVDEAQHGDVDGDVAHSSETQFCPIKAKLGFFGGFSRFGILSAIKSAFYYFRKDFKIS